MTPIEAYELQSGDVITLFRWPMGNVKLTVNGEVVLISDQQEAENLAKWLMGGI